MSQSENHPGWGGPRPGFGGKQPGAGRIQQRITLSLPTAQQLRRIARRWRDRDGADWTPARVVEVLIARELGMDADEVLRLKQISGLAEMFADREFSEAWEVAGD